MTPQIPLLGNGRPPCEAHALCVALLQAVLTVAGSVMSKFSTEMAHGQERHTSEPANGAKDCHDETCRRVNEYKKAHFHASRYRCLGNSTHAAESENVVRTVVQLERRQM